MADYYFDYMGPDYFRRRIIHEPELQALLPYLSRRDGRLEADRFSFYQHAVKFDPASWRGKRIVDFGGGDGWVTRRLFPDASVIVVEIGSHSESDRARLFQWADLVFCAHVLEHVPQPREVLEDVAGRMRPGAHLFLEVPADTQGPVGEVFDVCRREFAQLGRIAGNALVSMHEHIAHFSPRSLARLAEVCGAQVEQVYRSEAAIAVLARKL